MPTSLATPLGRRKGGMPLKKDGWMEHGRERVALDVPRLFCSRFLLPLSPFLALFYRTPETKERGKGILNKSGMTFWKTNLS